MGDRHDVHRRWHGRGGSARGGALKSADGALRELGAIAALSAPIALAQLGLVSMALVDTAILGRVAVDELAGASIARSIGFACLTPAIGIAAALEPIASQAVGASERGRAWSGLAATVRAGALLWLPCVAAGFAITLALPRLGVDARVVAHVRAYLTGFAPGMAASGVYLAIKTFLQAHRRTWPALAGSLAANVFNFFACNVLVRGDDACAAIGVAPLGLPKLGALGAGIAYTLATCVLVAFVLPAALARRARAGGEPVSVGQVYRLGIPVGLQALAEMGIFTLVALLSGALGAVVASAHQIALGLASFTFMGALGVSGATAVRVGHAIGAGRSPRAAGAIGIAFGGAVMSAGAIAFACFPQVLVSLFTRDARVAEIGVSLLRIAALFQLFDGVQAVAAGALRGAGDVRFPFVANVLSHWGVGFPVAIVLGFALHWGARGLWWGLTAGLVVVGIALAARFAVVSKRTIARV